MRVTKADFDKKLSQYDTMMKKSESKLNENIAFIEDRFKDYDKQIQYMNEDMVELKT